MLRNSFCWRSNYLKHKTLPWGKKNMGELNKTVFFLFLNNWC